MPEPSALGPIDPASIHDPSIAEEEKAAPWIMRKLIGSMTGRIVMSSYETLRATGTNVICLSPGGMAAVAAPVMGPVSDMVVTTIGDSILVELGMHTGFELSVRVANDLVFDKPIKHIVPIHSKRLETTGVKVLLITLKYKHTMSDAALGFYRSSLHTDSSLFSAVKDYLAVEKGWFSPYLFASGRRPIIPRNLKPDIIFCHGPFLSGDYRIGETLLAEAASVIALCAAPEPMPAPEPEPSSLAELRKGLSELSIPNLASVFHRSSSPSPVPDAALAPPPPPPPPRRMLITVLGLRPHRTLWTSSARPSESVLNYILLNGCPALVVPVKSGAPLVAWDGMTLAQLWEIALPVADGARSPGGKFEGVVDVVFEFVDLCIDWARVVVARPEDVNGAAGSTGALTERGEPAEVNEKSANSDGDASGRAKEALKDAITLLVAAAIRSKESKDARKELDADRSGIAMWRIP